MSPLRRASRAFRRLFLRTRVADEMAEEMRFHLDARAAQYAADGMSKDDAGAAAHKRFGNETEIRESAWDAHGFRGLERLGKDVRFALRQVAKQPGFALLAVVTLALGIGANTAMFGILANITLKPLPYPQDEKLDRLYRATPQDPEGNFSPADAVALRQAEGGYGEVAAYSRADASLSEPGRAAEMAEGVRVSGNFFALLGVTPEIGRVLGPGDDAPGSDHVAVLSRRAWQRRFLGSYDVIGRTIRLDGEPHTIVGVLPESFNDWRHLGWVDVFRPLAWGARKASDRSSADVRLIGRRADGRTRKEAWAFVAAFGERLAAQFPEANAGTTWHAETLRSEAAGKDGPETLAMLIGLSGFVLLIACSNLANFFLARTMARAREFAVRAALGASRLQLLRPLIVEALLVALGGGACALAVFFAAGRWIAVRSTGDNGERVVLGFDVTIFGWAFAASVVTALAFGIAPALFAMRLDVNGTLKSGGRGTTGGRGHQRFRQALVVAQFALAMVLLAGAGLFIRGLDDLNNRRAGWESARLVTASCNLPESRYANPGDVDAFQRRVLERLGALPGVSSVALSASTPFFGGGEARKLLVEGRALPERGHEPAAWVDPVTPRYFDTFGMRVLSGRTFDERDGKDAPRVFAINQSMARNLFPNESPLGRRIAWKGAGAPEWGEVVGVVADTQSVLPDATLVTFQVYLPMAQEPRRANELAVRAGGVAPASLVAGIAAAMSRLDPDLPLTKLQPADATILRMNYQLAVLRDMLTSFAVLGLALASLGIYGVIARLMAQRTSEFAIRLAMGAGVSDIVRLVLASGIAQALVGAAIGLTGALAVSRFLASAYPSMHMGGPGVLAGTTLILVAVALLACWMPARRAGRIDATLALRAD